MPSRRLKSDFALITDFFYQRFSTPRRLTPSSLPPLPPSVDSLHLYFIITGIDALEKYTSMICALAICLIDIHLSDDDSLQRLVAEIPPAWSIIAHAPEPHCP